jgi:drug/metabolite transporter (DMT)-like permease
MCIIMKSTAKTPTLLGLAAILLWSTTVAFTRSATEELGSLTSGALIYLIGGYLGCLYLALNGGLRLRLASVKRSYLFTCGFLFIIYIAAFYLALGSAMNRAQALEVGLINYLWPMLILLFSIPILNTRATWLALPAALIATVGIFLATLQNQTVSWPNFIENVSQNQAPYLLALLAAVSWAFYSNLSRKLAGSESGGAVPFFMLATGLVLGFFRLIHPEHSQFSIRAGAELLYLAIGPNLAYVFWDMAMRKGDVVLVASASYFTPLLSTLVSCLYLGLTPAWQLWLGCALIILGAVGCKLSIHETASTSP